MARLNDPPVPIESIDNLKRRFIRQNREIARVNSNQSLRIRNLEAEISRLLSENISLREKSIAAANEVERLQNSNQLSYDVRAMKDKLQAKLQEVNFLIEELGALPDNVRQRHTRKRNSDDLEQAKSPNERDWKNRQSIAGVLGNSGDLQEGRLPPILEDKYYPRRTLEPTELRLIIDQNHTLASESPDLGPPPVAHFEVQDVINFQPNDESKKLGQHDGEGEESSLLTEKVEKRRKRRTSSLLQDMSTVESIDTNSQEESQSQQKSTSKRKLDIAETENSNHEVTNHDDFTFQRRPMIPAANISGRRGTRFTRLPGKENETTTDKHKLDPQKNASSPSKVLVPKSTNSPIKKLTKDGEKFGLDRSGANESRRSTISARSRAGGVSKIRNELDKIKVNTVNMKDDEMPANELPPNTPAGLESILSPTSTEPSMKPSIKEAAVLNSVEDVLNGSIGRASRRAKAAVSYAEPNLRDKMRRPGKELVGAVEGIDRLRESSVRLSIGDGDRNRSEEPASNGSRGRRLKVESSQNEEDWKGLLLNHRKDDPTSPLTDKEIKESNRNRKDFPQEQKIIKAEVDFDGVMKRLSIFDPPDSPPYETSENDKNSTALNASIRKMTNSRRHSIQSTNTILNKPLTKPIPSRPSSAASMRNEGNKSTIIDLKRSNSVSKIKGQDMNGMMNSDRSEGTTSRRRSMMV